MMMKKVSKHGSFAIAAAAAIALLDGGAARAEVQLADVFADHMLLQRELPVAVWGRAEPGEGVTVEFQGQRKTATATAGADGRWQVTLDPLKADANPASLTVSSSQGGQPLIRNDVVVGEVWLIASQSNAGMALRKCLNPEQEIAAANDPLLRHMTNMNVFDGRSPRPDAECTWRVTTPQVAGDFHAVPYFFGRSLRRKLGVPVGVISLAYGGSRIEAWMTPEALATTEWGRETIDVWRGQTERGPGSFDHGDHPAAILNGKVAPLAPFAGGKAALEFDHVGGGLEAKDGPLHEFTIAGADGKFVEAAAEIEGDRVIVHSLAVAAPAAVRYGWANDPRCNLVTREGLPASPFRTDDWELPATHPHFGCHRPSRHAEMRILRRMKPVVIDGDLGDWDPSAAIFMHMHEFNRDTHNCRASLMYDDANLYLACHIKDPTPMRNNYTLAEAGMGWNADAVQVYLYGDPDNRSEIATWRDSPEKNDPAERNKIAQLTLWYSTAEKKPGFQITYGLDYRDAKVNPEGVEAAFKADADGAGYVLEYKIPQAVLHVPRALGPGDRIQAQFQVQWGRDDGRSWKFSVTDLTNPKGFNPTSDWDRAYHGPIGSGTAICE